MMPVNQIPYIRNDGMLNVQMHRCIVASLHKRTLALGGVFYGTGVNFQYGLSWLTRGEDASWKPAATFSPKYAIGYDISAGFAIGGYTYLGSVSEIDRSILETNYTLGDYNVEINGGGSFLGKLDVTGTYSPTANTVGSYLGIGVSPTPGLSGSLGVSSTFVIHDFLNTNQNE